MTEQQKADYAAWHVSEQRRLDIFSVPAKSVRGSQSTEDLGQSFFDNITEEDLKNIGTRIKVAAMPSCPNDTDNDGDCGLCKGAGCFNKPTF